MKKFSATFAAVILVLTLCFLLTACGTFEGFDNDDAIIKGKSFSTVSSVVNNTSNSYSFRAKKCNGVKSIKNITLPDNPVFDMTLKIKNGRFKIVLVKDDTVFLVCDADIDSPLTVEIPAGKYNLRMVAEDANVEFTFKYNSYSA